MRTAFLVILVLLACPNPGRPARSQTLLGQQREIAACELQYGTNARAPLAISSIHAACGELSAQRGPLHDRDRQYDLCLLRHLQNAQSNAAASQIMSACRQLVPLF